MGEYTAIEELQLHIDNYKEQIINHPKNNSNKKAGLQIMTYHASKGLEFNICYFSGLYSKFNIREAINKFSYDNKYDDIYVFGDFNRLKQVFVNIIKNSMESITGSGIIKIVVKVRAKQVVIEVSDNGCGMTDEDISNIKEMFYSTKKNGSGLGVALSNEIVVAHNGSLSYSSVYGKGTVCTVKLPM